MEDLPYPPANFVKCLIGEQMSFDIKCMVVIPRFAQSQGALVEDKIVADMTEDFENILKSNHIPYERINDNFVIWGYK